MKWGFILVAVMVLSACASSSSTSSTTTTNSPTTGALAACSDFLDGEPSLLDRIPKAVLAIGDTATQDDIDEMQAIHDGIEAAAVKAPADLALALRTVDKPFADFVRQIDSGATSVSITTEGIANDTTTVMGLCVDAGFKVAGASETSSSEDLTPIWQAAVDCDITRLPEDEGMSITFDTRGKEDEGIDDLYDPIEDITCMLEKLDAPDYVTQHIESTRALDGMQTDEWDDMKARWTYHPDDGLGLTLIDQP